MEFSDATFFKVVLDQIPLHVVVTDIDGKIKYANLAVQTITGYSPDEAVGKTASLWGGLMDEMFYRDMWKTIKVDQKMYNGIIKNKRKNGQEYYAAIRICPIKKDGKLVGFCGIEQDMSNVQALSDMFDMEVKQKEMLKREIEVLETRLKNG